MASSLKVFQPQRKHSTGLVGWGVRWLTVETRFCTKPHFLSSSFIFLEPNSSGVADWIQSWNITSPQGSISIGISIPVHRSVLNHAVCISASLCARLAAFAITSSTEVTPVILWATTDPIPRKTYLKPLEQQSCQCLDGCTQPMRNIIHVFNHTFLGSGKMLDFWGFVVHAKQRWFTPNKGGSRKVHGSFTGFHAPFFSWPKVTIGTVLPTFSLPKRSNLYFAANHMSGADWPL